MSTNTECRRIIFHGRVQGVGFRYTTHRIARRFAVTGFVRNLADGTVELVACGADSELQNLLAAINDEFAVNIESVDDDVIDPPEVFSSFEIRY